ncbi:MAG: ferredoxin oxidoreductase [Candidatus Omnitrophica bacterium]|nr:ferredoxin oxidoreductase [Candidatus Omnitrophota bacterium]MBU0878521.1 ferredoxin oxidoreductase [Candidatus Omnitrophota bacterium]MBU0896219.1 ferredoxin oxidoreductase [Candidatus Omnitrophota bacterium]MBU1133450.1 ferredoxin oxidoreductase [Candidatus Omnitrophota bacterium]MBU1366787.1 ferredoxin oxidoreductase [Candidatus Omnitrophota bacterium]
MSVKIVKISPGFEEIMPKDYKDLVSNGPYGKGFGIKELGTFKELIEEHPLCAGCGLALSKRLILASLPSPENTIIVGTTGCSSLSFSQVALHNIHSIFGNQNAVATGLKRALEIRFPDVIKDVVAIGGDGAIGDIGLGMVMHSWFRGEKFATIMLDNESYANTGGQESGMSQQGAVLNMAPTGKKYNKLPMAEIARDAGCVYSVSVTFAKPKRLEKIIRRAVLIARQLGPTYIQIYCPCPTNYKHKPSESLERARDAEKSGAYPVKEYMSPEAEELIKKLEEGKKC